VIADDEIWQADEGDFRPFRRRVRYQRTRPVLLAAITTQLALTSGLNWGHQLRRGLVSLDPADVELLRDAMNAQA
jgi:hypothetical protein